MRAALSIKRDVSHCEEHEARAGGSAVQPRKARKGETAFSHHEGHEGREEGNSRTAKGRRGITQRRNGATGQERLLGRILLILLILLILSKKAVFCAVSVVVATLLFLRSLRLLAANLFILLSPVRQVFGPFRGLTLQSLSFNP
jgi:hypothetical protein